MLVRSLLTIILYFFIFVVADDQLSTNGEGGWSSTNPTITSNDEGNGNGDEQSETTFTYEPEQSNLNDLNGWTNNDTSPVNNAVYGYDFGDDKSNEKDQFIDSRQSDVQSAPLNDGLSIGVVYNEISSNRGESNQSDYLSMNGNSLGPVSDVGDFGGVGDEEMKGCKTKTGRDKSKTKEKKAKATKAPKIKTTKPPKAPKTSRPTKKPKEKKVDKQKPQLFVQPKPKVVKKKEDKKPQPLNPNHLKWKGKTVVTAGQTALDVPEAIPKIGDGEKKPPNFGASCLKNKPKKPVRKPSGILASDVAENPEVNVGPTAEQVEQTDFQPCVERNRGGKAVGKRSNTHFRRKRSESYAALNWLWNNPENIPVMFDKSFPEKSKVVARDAMTMWTNSTCVKFVEIAKPPAANAPYILVTSGGGTCTTDRLGPNVYAPYTTTIDATLCLNNTGSLSHEFGHAIGLAHSQKRVDRDEYLSIYPNNIAEAWKPQFDKDNTQYFSDWGVPFYYDSIMQYFPYAATANTFMTVCPLDPLMEVLMGQREEPAFGDLALINRMYCQESCFNRSSMSSGFTGALSMTISGRTCQNWALQIPHKHRFASVGNHSFCRNPDGWPGGPWCYTTEPTIVYEPCFSACEDLAALGRPYCEGWCYNGGYHDPDTCDCVCPRYAFGRWCENVDKSKKYGHLTCGGKIRVLPNQVYGISSPNWPQNYSSNEVCMWWLQVPVGMKIQLTFSDFSIELADETGCYDYLEIRKSLCASATTLPSDMRFCGLSLAPDQNGVNRQVVSDDNNMVLKFVTDEGEFGRGFSVMIRAIPT